jgi:hypothetical protein
MIENKLPSKEKDSSKKKNDGDKLVSEDEAIVVKHEEEK